MKAPSFKEINKWFLLMLFPFLGLFLLFHYTQRPEVKDQNDLMYVEGRIKDYSFKAGFEKNFIYGHIQPYLGFDMGFRSNEFDGTLTDNASNNVNVSTTKRGFTLAPVLGLKLNPIKEISIFAESNLEFFYAWGKTDYTGLQDPQSRGSNKFQKGELLNNPVSVGIQIHLGRKN